MKKYIILLIFLLITCISFAYSINRNEIYLVQKGNSLYNISVNSGVYYSGIKIIYRESGDYNRTKTNIERGDLIIFPQYFKPENSMYFKYKSKLNKSPYVITVKSGYSYYMFYNKFHIKLNLIANLYKKNSKFLTPGDKLLLPIIINKNDLLIKNLNKKYNKLDSKIVSNINNKKKIKTIKKINASVEINNLLKAPTRYYYRKNFKAKLLRDVIYIVKPGDSLQLISEKLRIGSKKLYAWNRYKFSRKLYPGEKIIIKNTYGVLYVSEKGDTLIKVMKAFHVSPSDIVILSRANENSITPGDDFLIFNDSFNYKNIKNSAYGWIPQFLFSKLEQKLVKKYSKQFNVNPYLIYAIIKAESSFNNTVRSYANCYGLMQLSLPTAQMLDSNINLQNIYYPSNNIRLGTEYFKLLLDQFNNNIVYAIAAYNAGEGNVQHWIRRYGSFSISQIPFGATKSYVRVVIKYFNSFKNYYYKNENILSILDSDNSK